MRSLPVFLMLGCWSLTTAVFAIEVNDLAVVKADADRKLSGKVVGKVKADDIVRIREVRGAWIDIGTKTQEWIRADNVLAGREALSRLEKRVEAEPDNRELRRQFTRLQSQWVERDESAGGLDRLLEREPDNAFAHFQRGKLFLQGGDFNKAIEYFDDAIRLQEDVGEFYVHRGRAKQATNQFVEAADDFELAVKHQGADAETYNMIAWWRATWPDAKRRDGKKAVEYALEACKRTHYDNWAFVDTLAAAYAESGDFPSAIKYQEQAVAQCDDFRQEADMQKRLEQYRQSKPYREEPH